MIKGRAFEHDIEHEIITQQMLVDHYIIQIHVEVKIVACGPWSSHLPSQDSQGHLYHI